MAAAAAAEVQQPVSAQVVGNAFVMQYYHILHQSPGLVHKFYQDISKVGRPEEDGSMSITTTMQAINEKIISLNCGDFRAEIKSVDSQASLNGGVNVLVTGYLTAKDNKVSHFAQSFFLAPQDRGYFVLNDMFRYVNNVVNPPVVMDVVVPVTEEPVAAPVPVPVQENHVSEESTPSPEEAVSGEVYNPPENGDVPVTEEEEVPVAEVVDEVQDNAEPVVESPAKVDDAPKKSYASIVVDDISESAYRSSFPDHEDNVWFSGDLFWNNSKIPGSSGTHQSSKKVVSETELPQKVLESLFNMPTPKAAEQEPNKMNWRNIVKQMVSLGQGVEGGESAQQQYAHSHAKGDDYHVLRESAHQLYDSMKSYYQKAVTGERAYASYLSELGKLQNKKAQEADKKASHDIFAARNKSIENMITFDLHGQHIKQGMKVLKLHLLFGAYVRSVKLFRVITGYGSHGVGKSKLKTSVIGLLQKEGIKWSEENRGTLLIRLEGQTDFSFFDSGSGSDDD